MNDVTFRQWFENEEGRPTGPFDITARKLAAGGKALMKQFQPRAPMSASDSMAAQTDWDALSKGGIPSTSDQEDHANFGFTNDDPIRRVHSVRSSTQKLGAKTDWDDLAKDGIPSTSDQEDHANFGFASKRNLMSMHRKVKEHQNTLYGRTEEFLAGIPGLLWTITKETKTIGYQTVAQVPDIMVVKPAQETARLAGNQLIKLKNGLQGIVTVITTRGKQAEQALKMMEMGEQLPEEEIKELEGTLGEARAALEELTEGVRELQKVDKNAEQSKEENPGNPYMNALKMVGYGVVIGHWLFALVAFLTFTGQVHAFEHWLDHNTAGIGLGMLIAYKILVNVLIMSKDSMEATAKANPNTLGGMISGWIVGAINWLTPAQLKHMGPPTEKKDFVRSTDDYETYQKDFRIGRQVGLRGDDLPQWDDETSSYSKPGNWGSVNPQNWGSVSNKDRKRLLGSEF